MIDQPNTSNPAAVSPAGTVTLEPLGARGQQRWTARLERDVISLWGAKERPVMAIARASAPQHIRFHWDLRHGHTVSFIVVEGMKSHTFRCPKAQRAQLLTWLPRKSNREILNEVRVNAGGLAVLALIFLGFGQMLGFGWGALLMVTALAGAVNPKPWMYALFGGVLTAAGVGQIVAGAIALYPATPADDVTHLARTIAACVAFCWAVHQFAMLTANAQIRAARVKWELSGMRTQPSALVHWTGDVIVRASLLLWAYTAGLVVAGWFGSNDQALDGFFTDVQLARFDLAGFAALSAATLGTGLALRRRWKPAYAEAKVALQALVATGVVLGWRLIEVFSPASPGTFFGPILSTGGEALTQPFVWVTMLALVVLLNRWFNKRIDEELEQRMELASREWMLVPPARRGAAAHYARA